MLLRSLLCQVIRLSFHSQELDQRVLLFPKYSQTNSTNDIKVLSNFHDFNGLALEFNRVTVIDVEATIVYLSPACEDKWVKIYSGQYSNCFSFFWDKTLYFLNFFHKS